MTMNQRFLDNWKKVLDDYLEQQRNKGRTLSNKDLFREAMCTTEMAEVFAGAINEITMELDK